MRRFAFLILFAGGLLLPTPAAPAAEDREVLFYLAPSGLMAIEFQIAVEGKPFKQAWDEALDEQFQKLDKDQDGEIAGVERDLLPNTRLLRLMDPNGFANPVAPSLMDRKAFGSYMEKLGFQPFKINVAPAPNQMVSGSFVVSGMQNDPEQAAKLLFAKLDQDADGRLSRKEMDQAPASLAKLDLDQDETISAAELVPVNYNAYFGLGVRDTQRTNDQNPFLALSGRASHRQAATQLTARYDTREKDNALSRAEIALPEKLFAEHDIDGNGKWDFEEIQQYLKSPTPNITIRIRLRRQESAYAPGKSPKPAENTIEFQHGDELASSVKNGIGSLSLDAAQLEVSLERDRGGNIEGILKSQFGSMDADNNGYIDKEESQRFGQFTQFFQELDRDRDGKLFFEEITAGVLPVAKLMRNQIQISVTDRGKDLFRILDSNGDNRLSLREFWDMPNRAALWAKDGEGGIALADVPQQYRLVAGLGQFNLFNRFNGVVVARPIGGSAPTIRASNSGPMWFQKMDRNADGDISRKEFLGTIEDFQKLDQNNDGLIAPDEAERS